MDRAGFERLVETRSILVLPAAYISPKTNSWKQYSG